MKKALTALMAIALFSAVPALAMEHTGEHAAQHDMSNMDCAKECDMLLKNCAQDVDTLQYKIKKLQAALKQEGADQAQLDRVKALKLKLEEAQATLRALEKPGH
ncbi:hypothetical protein GMLC_20460 [Geomonas limicola]|uniref:DUF1090 domain-containing protein n=1 Tax=Geomonas limicola TaxID=2740186 RepID=A0A6V8N9I9_9BACT|nr:hypothetical protein [Geomonas limicola]GFO68467.1 hypothetical protein GMLC_20460 [Geomonas limicola]